MPDVSSNAKKPNATRNKILVGVAVFVIVALALFVRVYWNMDVAQQDDGFVMSGGSDPYYHLRAINYIQEHGWQTLIEDPLLNYPYGAVNPNPPLFHWSVAVAGAALSPFFGGNMDTATWWAALWSPAIWGALAVIPTYLIGRDVFNRRTGILAALLVALSTTHITNTSFGNAEHDAMYMFFAVLGVWTYIRAIQAFRTQGYYVTDWRDPASIRSGLSRFFSENKPGLGWSLATGLSVGAVALMWKGFPYLVGILFIYLAIQLLVDHWRNTDSTGIWAGTLVAVAVAALLAAPVYANQNVFNFLKPVWFLIAGVVAMGAVMLPTRDLPTILVIPAFAVAGLIGVLVAFFVFPDVAQQLLYATVYFRQTSIYQTIAEAHPADFNSLVFGIGPVAFFLAIGGLVALLFKARGPRTGPMLFTFVWAVIAIYMAQSAIRFLFNATPILAILAAWATILILDWVDFRGVGRALRNAPNFWTGVRRGVNAWHITSAVLVALLLVFPNVMIAVDAGTPAEVDSERSQDSDFYGKRFGAFGQSFLPGYWQEGFEWLSGLDDYGSDPGNEANRPGFVSWWDYGHWAIVAGDHPSVADNFQNGYEYAAHFLLAQNETHNIQLMSARSFELLEEQGVQPRNLVEEVGVPSSESADVVAAMKRWEYVPQLSMSQAVALENLVQEHSQSDLRPDGVRIRYFAADIRMLPFDDPNTPSVDQPSIFYAPVILKGDDPDKYVTTKIRATDGQFYTQEEFQKKASQVQVNPNFQSQGSRLEYQEPFMNSMYYRAFVGSPMQAGGGLMQQQQGNQPILGNALNQALAVPQPGNDMSHWRLSFANPQLRILEYYPGAIMEGTVTRDGEPVAGATVTAHDDAGGVLYQEVHESLQEQLSPDDLNVPHDSNVTDEEGRFRVILPFSETNGTTVVVTDNAGVELARHTLDVSREDSNARRVFEQDLVVQDGNVEGFAFHDVAGDGTYNETAGDAPVADAEVTIGGVAVTTGEDGTYLAEGVSAGQQTVTVNHTEYEVAPMSARVAVRPDETTTHNISLQPKAVEATGRLAYDADGDGAQSDGDEPVPEQPFAFQPEGDTGRPAQTATSPEGNFTVELAPGTYTVDATFQAPDGTTYVAEDVTVTVESGQGLVDLGTLLLVEGTPEGQGQSQQSGQG